MTQNGEQRICIIAAASASQIRLFSYCLCEKPFWFRLFRTGHIFKNYLHNPLFWLKKQCHKNMFGACHNVINKFYVFMSVLEQCRH